MQSLIITIQNILAGFTPDTQDLQNLRRLLVFLQGGK